MQIQVIVALVLGFLVGIVVNLLADYLPARRHFVLARTSPFASVKPIRPLFFPRTEDGRVASPVFWSGLVLALLPSQGDRAARAPLHRSVRVVRRAVVEVGMSAAFAAIVASQAGQPFLWFYLAYAVVLTLVTVTDIEHRWVLPEVIWSGVALAMLEILLVGRIAFADALQGAVTGFGVMFVLYIFGFVFARFVHLLTGRHVGRTVLGFGDVRLAAWGGLILGSGAIGPALLLAILAGGLGAIGFILNKRIRRGRYRRFSAMPYGPFLAFGIAFMMYAPSAAFDVLRAVINLV